jgi:hypothetical protein
MMVALTKPMSSLKTTNKKIKNMSYLITSKTETLDFAVKKLLQKQIKNSYFGKRATEVMT